VSTTSPEAEGHGEFSPQRVQQVKYTSPLTNKLLFEAGLGTSYYQWGGKERPDNQTRDLIRVFSIGQTVVPATATTPAVTANFNYRSQNWLNNKTNAVNWFGNASYVTGSHSLKFGYQGYWWMDDRELNVNNQALQYTFIGGAPFSINQYINKYNINARAMAMSFFAQDQWTMGRLTLQGALRFDRPWSWFPEVTQPASPFFAGATFQRADGVTGYNDLTPRMGLAYDLFGNGKTALKVNLGKYLQGASVSNLAYGANPSLRIPAGTTTFGGIFNPNVSRNWTDVDGDFIVDCDLKNGLAQSAATTGSVDTCGQWSDLAFGGTQTVGARFDEGLLSGWGVRPSDWSFGASVQQEIFPRASVEVGYYRRWFTQFQTGGTVNDNQLIAPSDLAAYTVTAPTDSRLPTAGQTVGPLYNPNTNVFGRSDILIRSTKDIGDDTRVFNGVDVNLNIRMTTGITFSGGTSTGKVKNDWCDIRAAVPEAFLLNPYCEVESPWQTSVRGLITYTIPRIDVNVSSVIQDKPNIGTDQLGSLAANYTLSAADLAAAQAQIGRPLNTTGATTVNLIPGGVFYGDRVRQWDFAVKKIMRLGGQRLTVGADFYNLLNNNVTLAFNQTYSPTTTGWLTPTTYMNPRVIRLNAEFTW
jgi:hypothetical protein